nr:hypothetical protein H12I19.6 - Caenorhabditis elegans [Caenorhabditis elegans]
MTIIKLERRDVRLLLLYEFRLGHSAMEAERNICGAMGEGALSYNTTKSWFQKFKNGDFSLEEIERSGRPVELNEEDLVKLVEEEPRLSLREMEEKLECCHSTIARHLGRLGFTSKLGIWVPHELSASQKLTRVNVCTQLLTFRRKFDWLNNLVTGDEKWVLYVNHSRKRQWLPIGEKGIPTPKPDLHPKKIMICVWWGVQGPVHWELLPTNKTITADYYCAQLDRVAEKTNGKYEKLYFLHDNARPHVAKKTFQKLQDLGWTVLPHPPYSPDLAPTDYHLFLSLSDYMRDKQFDDEEHLKTELSTFFSSRSPDFFSRGIMMLPSKWQQVVDTNGEYLCE